MDSTDFQQGCRRMGHWKRTGPSKASSSMKQQSSATSGSIFSASTEKVEAFTTLHPFSSQVNVTPFLSPQFQTHQTCVCGPTGQAANGSATRKIQETRQEDFRTRKLNFHKKLHIFAMKVRCSAVTKTAQVNIWSGFSLYSFQCNTLYF